MNRGQITERLAYLIYRMYKHHGWAPDSHRDWTKAEEIVEINLKRDPTGSTLDWVLER